MKEKIEIWKAKFSQIVKSTQHFLHALIAFALLFLLFNQLVKVQPETGVQFLKLILSWQVLAFIVILIFQRPLKELISKISKIETDSFFLETQPESKVESDEKGVKRLDVQIPQASNVDNLVTLGEIDEWRDIVLDSSVNFNKRLEEIKAGKEITVSILLAVELYDFVGLSRFLVARTKRLLNDINKAGRTKVVDYHDNFLYVVEDLPLKSGLEEGFDKRIELNTMYEILKNEKLITEDSGFFGITFKGQRFLKFLGLK
ncbi:hypothetical protein HYV12_04255 [Candidatus Dojkabacteria bacterium]|nr:hypothetical protein [Candidatus Dojkabacteria bacterium]